MHIANNSPAEINRPKNYLNNHSIRFYETYKLASRLIERGNSVLSVGAGRAFVEFVLAQENACKVTVFDFAEAIQRNSDQYSPYAFKTIAGNFIEDSALIEEGKFDMILFCEIVEHIPLPPKEQFKKAIEFLKPGGYLIISTPNIASINSIVNLLSGKNIIASPEKLFSAVSSENEHVHRREYIMSEMVDASVHCGMKIVTQEYIFMRPPHMKFTSLCLYAFLQLFKKWRPMMLISAKKE